MSKKNKSVPTPSPVPEKLDLKDGITDEQKSKMTVECKAELDKILKKYNQEIIVRPVFTADGRVAAEAQIRWVGGK